MLTIIVCLQPSHAVREPGNICIDSVDVLFNCHNTALDVAHGILDCFP